MSDRRSFLRDVSYSVMGLPLVSHLASMEPIDWSDWAKIKEQYPSNNKGLRNYNCGSAGIQPKVVLEAFKSYQKALSAYAPYEVYEKHKVQVNHCRQRLADLVNAESEEIALVRNTTEAINAVLYGIVWQKDDEILISEVDYPLVWNTVNALKSRYGIIIKTVKANVAKDSDAQIIQNYKKNLTPKSKLILATQVTHREGHIMPVGALSALGRQHGVEVLIDGAHAFGQLEVDVRSIGCQYYATSLHKWLSAPLGTGMLYVQKDRIASLLPPTSYDSNQIDSIDKFMMIGTFAFEKWMTLETVLDFQDRIGLETKRDRLNMMSTRFRMQLAEIPDVTLASNQSDCGGITAFRIESTNNAHLFKNLQKDYGCHIKKVGMYKTKILFLRTSFNLHLDESDVDYLVDSIKACI